MNLNCKSESHWPALAWLAQFERDGEAIHLRHGHDVEVGEDWFAEAVWAGPFEGRDFDQTDLFFGSGGRLRDGRWVFVSSGTTLDRLHSYRSGNVFYVSNSLACLTVAINAQVDPHDRSYFAFFESIIHGLEKYQAMLTTSAGEVRLTYYRNLEFDGTSLREIDKPTIQRDLSEYAKYKAFLIESMKSLGANIAAPTRMAKLASIASISTGYDSPAVAALARHAGLQDTLSIVDSRGGANDDGSEIARVLGLNPISFFRDDWRITEQPTRDVTRFIASDAKGEDVYFASAASALSGRVLFSGYRGSRVWKPSSDDRADMSRSDQSGLSHTEARLHGSYIHVPLPFMGCLQENAIRAIGRSGDLSNWSLGGDYNQPVSRRLVEEAGVPRELFGQEKKAASILLFDRTSFLPPAALESFAQWCHHHQIGRRNASERLLNSGRRVLRVRGGGFLELAQKSLQRAPLLKNLPFLGRLARSGRLREMASYEPEFDYLFPWALAETQQAYR